MKIRKTVLLLSLFTAFAVCSSVMPISPLKSLTLMTAEAASNVFVDIDGNKITLGDGIPTAVIYGRPECFNTRTTLNNIIGSSLTDKNDLHIIYADIDGNNIETVKAFREELGSDKIIFCSDENASGSMYSSRMYADIGISESITLPVICCYDGSGTLLSYTTGLQEAGALYETLIGKESAAASEESEEENKVLDEKTPSEDDTMTPFISKGGSLLEKNSDGTYTMVQSIRNDDEYGKAVSIIDPEAKTVTFLKGIKINDERLAYTFIGEKYNFLVTGNSNESESNSVVVLRVKKYSKDWDYIEELEIKGDNTYSPFETIDMMLMSFRAPTAITEYDGKLYIHNSHKMYYSSGANHQSNWSYIIDEESLDIISKSSGIGSTDIYVSHSFGQLLAIDETGAYYVDQGDGYPRAIVLNKTNGKSLSAIYRKKLINIAGESGDNATGAFLGDIILTEKTCLTSFASIEQNENDSMYGPQDLYVSVTDKETGETKTNKLTTYTADEHNAILYILAFFRVNDKNYLVWQQGDPKYESAGPWHWYNTNADENNKKILCAEISDDGEITGDILDATNVPISDSMIADDNGMLKFAASDIEHSDYVTIYTLDPTTMTIASKDNYYIPGTEPSFSSGDVNGDGKIDANDATTVLVNYSLLSTGEPIQLTEEQQKAADVNGDGKIDASDATKILQYYSYLSTGGDLEFKEYMKQNG